MLRRSPKNLLVWIGLFVTVALAASPAYSGGRRFVRRAPPRGPAPNIVELAQSAPQLSILVEAVSRAGLVDALAGPEPLTVFAPDNDAFLALLADLGFASLDAVPLDALTAILLDHVVPGENRASRLEYLARNDGGLNPLGGLPLEFDRRPLEVNDIAIVTADLRASNGVVHVIDAVLLEPDPRPLITELAVASPGLSVLVQAAVRSGLDRVLAAGAPFTVFAPTDAAFGRLLDALGVASLDDIDDRTLVNVLLDHVVAGEIDPIDAKGRRWYRALGRLPIVLDLDRDRVNGIAILGEAIEAENGTIYVIDDVLLER